MSAYLAVFSTLVVPAVWGLLILLNPSGSPWRWAAGSLPLAAYYLVARELLPWWIPGYPARGAVGMYVATVVIFDLIRSIRGAATVPRSEAITGGVTAVVVVALTAALLVHVRRRPTPAIDLSSPFGPSLHAVAQGGPTVLQNLHNATGGVEDFALDLVKLDDAGRRARGLAPRRLEEYFSFGEPVFSPTNGVVVKVVDGVPDLPPPARTTAQPPGNCVVIQAGELRVLLAHFQAGSIRVKEGEAVRTGQRLANAGNSGNTTEPHLHLGVMEAGMGRPFSLDHAVVRRNTILVSKPNAPFWSRLWRGPS